MDRFPSYQSSRSGWGCRLGPFIGECPADSLRCLIPLLLLPKPPAAGIKGVTTMKTDDVLPRAVLDPASRWERAAVPVSSTLPSEHELSHATREWWRWVLVRVGQLSDQIQTDADREEFVRQWAPDMFDWTGDYRWNIDEWARLHGIAMAAQSEQEYEEAQFWTDPAQENIVNATWGSNGMNVDIYGLLPTFDGPYFAPYMSHVAPKWHLAVEQGNSRHGRASIADAMSQDNAIGLGIHSDSGWGFGPWEEKGFAQARGAELGLTADFSIGDYMRQLLNITWSKSESKCQPHVDMIGLYGRWVIPETYPHAASRDGLTLSECCEWCGNTTECTGFTNYGDPAIHGPETCDPKEAGV